MRLAGLVAVLLLVAACTPSDDGAESPPPAAATGAPSPTSAPEAAEQTPAPTPEAVPLPGSTATVENATFIEEPEAARTATDELEQAVAAGDSSRVVARPEDTEVVADLGTLELDETTWDRVGNVATVAGVADGETYLVWLIRFEDGTWRVSHTTDPEPST